MPQHLSRTLAVELATRTISVVNPQNRTMALDTGLRRHGIPLREHPESDVLLDHRALVAWLLKTYGMTSV